MKRKLLFWLLFCGSLLLFGFQTIEAFGIVAFHAEFFEKKPTIVIDAGHGGEDGGAVGINGLVEKDVNLSIALSLAEDLKANHFTVILVRDGDYSVGDQSLSTVAERKRSDTKTNSPKANTVARKCSIPPITLKAPNWQKQSGKVLSPLYSRKTPGRIKRRGRRSTC